jgi:hypothetical protein
MILLRVLWGEEGPISRWGKVWYSNLLHHSKDTQPPEQHIYVYGHDNADRLVAAGFKNVLLVDNSPWPDGKQDFFLKEFGLKYGRRHPWHYKFQMLKKAVEDHGEVVYCDWDVLYVKRDWGLVQKHLENRTLTLNAYLYRRPRHRNRTDLLFQKVSVTGSWMHHANTEFIDIVLNRMSQPGDRNWHDEFVMGDILDEQYNGWMGEEVWLSKYETPIRVLEKTRSPWVKKTDDGFTVTRQTPIDFTWYRIFI